MKRLSLTDSEFKPSYDKGRSVPDNATALGISKDTLYRRIRKAQEAPRPRKASMTPTRFAIAFLLKHSVPVTAESIVAQVKSAEGGYVPSGETIRRALKDLKGGGTT